MTAIEMIVCYPQFPRGGTPRHGGGTQREAPGWVRRQRELGGKCGQESSLWFLWERTSEAGEAGLGLASLDNFSGLWGIGAVPSGLVPGSGMIRTGG